MLAAPAGVGHRFRHELVRLQIEAVADDQFRRLDADQLADLRKVGSGHVVFGQNQRLLMRDAPHEPERGWHYVHFAVSNQQVAVGAEAFHAFVLVPILMVGVEEIAMAQHQIEHRIAIAVGLLGIAAEDVIDGSAVVVARWRLAIAVERGIAARVGQPFRLKAVCAFYHAEVGIAVAAADLEVQVRLLESRLEPVLEVELFIGGAHALDERPLAHGLHACFKDGENCRRGPCRDQGNRRKKRVPRL